ncbi:hypothetical protein [Caulobacter sp. HMWF025]|uniref:hypothetical protein n=1 Tax=Caulobacter sp. HMWF025 TaxID=2056860 RepID=UPI0018EEA525|nr:hypothetical protein [Caulobacter sp. HMWF025]
MRATAYLVCLSFVAGPVLGQPAQGPAAPASTPVPAPQPEPATPPGPVAAPAATPAAPAPTPTVPPESVDPLGDLIDQSGPLTTDEEDAVPTAPAAPHKPTLLPIPAPEPAPAAGSPATASGSAPMPAEQVYELRIKASVAAAQGLQGPLDGGWTVRDPEGRALYTLQLVDPASGNGPVEGAWRDVRRPGSVGSTGLIDTVERSGEAVVVRFTPLAGQSAALTVNPVDETRWSGTLVENGVGHAVVAEQQPPPSLPPGYVVRTRGPVVWPPRVAASRPATVPTCSTKGKKGKALKAARARCAALAKKSGKGKAVAKGKKGAKAKATAARKKAAVKKKAS